MISYLCYMITASGQLINLDNGVMCPRVSAPIVETMQPVSPPQPITSPVQSLTGEEQFIDGILSVVPAGTPLFDAIFSDALDPLPQGQRVCNGQSINEAKPASLTADEWATYQATVRVLATRYLCP